MITSCKAAADLSLLVSLVHAFVVNKLNSTDPRVGNSSVFLYLFSTG